jgi:hypothetical protein
MAEFVEPTSKDRKRAARLIAALLSNPATPASLADAITDELAFYAEFLDYTDPKIVETVLSAFEKAIKEDGGQIVRDETTVPNTARRMVARAGDKV